MVTKQAVGELGDSMKWLSGSRCLAENQFDVAATKSLQKGFTDEFLTFNNYSSQNKIKSDQIASRSLARSCSPNTVNTKQANKKKKKGQQSSVSIFLFHMFTTDQKRFQRVTTDRAKTNYSKITTNSRIVDAVLDAWWDVYGRVGEEVSRQSGIDMSKRQENGWLGHTASHGQWMPVTDTDCLTTKWVYGYAIE